MIHKIPLNLRYVIILGTQEIEFLILRTILDNGGYYRDFLIQTLQRENLDVHEIECGIDNLSKLGMIQCYGFHTAYVVHPNIELVFEKNPKISFPELVEIWNDPETISELWESDENE